MTPQSCGLRSRPLETRTGKKRRRDNEAKPKNPSNIPPRNFRSRSIPQETVEVGGEALGQRTQGEAPLVRPGAPLVHRPSPILQGCRGQVEKALATTLETRLASDTSKCCRSIAAPERCCSAYAFHGETCTRAAPWHSLLGAR
eukprot:scaffold7041_cov311-Pinguiococcus_pyrenoidosus.AAC.4